MQQVLKALLISHIELRSEESEDIQKYSHERSVEKIVVPLGEALSLAKDLFLKVAQYTILKPIDFQWVSLLNRSLKLS